MDEDFKDVTENSKKMVIIFVMIIIIFALLGYFFIFKKYHFAVRNLEHELGENLSQNVEDYITGTSVKAKNYKLDLSGVNKDEVGEYTYKITYNKSTKKGKIKVVDKTAPKYELQDLVIEEGNEDYYLGDFLLECIDMSKPCLVTLKNNNDEAKFKTPGTHQIKIVIKDLYGNKTDAVGTLKVVPKGTYVDPKSQDLEIASNSKEIENFTGLIYEKLDKALNKDSEEANAKMSEISTVDLEEYVRTNYKDSLLKSSEIIMLYNKSNYVVGYSIELIISENGKEKVVYVEKSKISSSPITDEESQEN